MYRDGKKKANGRLKTLALTFVIFGFASVDAFYSTLTLPSARMPKMALAVATSIPTNRSGTDSGGDDQPNRNKRNFKTIRKGRRTTKNAHSFQQYLKGISKGFKSKWKLAQRMDDELKRMEMEVYDIAHNDPAYESLGRTKIAFSGERAKPDARCYASVCNAYANAGFGETAAELAEQVAERYQRLTGELPNSHITTAVMKAWVQADMWDKADFWLKRMEDRYAETGNPRDAPDCISYTSYVSGLSTTRSLDRKTAGARARDILYKMRDLNLSGENTAARPNRYTYSYVMKCQERAHTGFESLEHVEKIYRQLEEDYQNIGVNALKPNSFIGVGLMHAAAHCGGGIKAADKAELYLEEFKRRFDETNDEDFRPIEGMYTSLLASYGKVESTAAEKYASKVDAVLDDMKNYGIKPQLYAITAAINAKVNHRSYESVLQAEKLLRRMDKPDAVTYQCLIRACTRIGRASKADQLMKELESLSGPKTIREDTDVMTMGATINAWCRDKDANVNTAIERSEELLQKIITKYRDGLVGPDERHVDTWVFESVIRLWSTSRKPDSVERIASLIDQMESLNKEVPGLFKPTLNVYLLVLDAWAKSGREEAGKMAMETLRKVEQMHRAGKVPEPSVRMLSSTLVSLTRSSGPGISKMAEGLYGRILERYRAGDRGVSVNARTLTSLLSMILSIPGYDASKRAQRILRQTIELGRESIDDIAPNTIVFNCMLNGLARRRDSDAAWGFLQEMKQLRKEGYLTEPDNVTYSCVARAVAGDRNRLSVQRLKEITDEIFELSEKGKLEPDIQLYNTVLNGYSFTAKHDPTCADMAKQLLTNLEMSSLVGNPVTPDMESYAAVAHTFALSKLPDSASQTEEMLRRANELAREGKISFPGTEFYSYVVLAHARNGTPESLEKAISFIETMESSEEEGTKYLQPLTYTYNMVLASCASSGELEIAERLFEKQKSRAAAGHKCAPDTHSHNWLILTTGRASPPIPEESRRAFDLALEHFKYLHSNSTSLEPDSSTYEFFLQSCFRLLPHGEVRSKLVSRALALARIRGLVTGQVCREAYKSDPHLVLKMMNATRDEGECHAVVPLDWCNQVPYKRRDRKVRLGPPGKRPHAGFSRKHDGNVEVDV